VSLSISHILLSKRIICIATYSSIDRCYSIVFVVTTFIITKLCRITLQTFNTAYGIVSRSSWSMLVRLRLLLVIKWWLLVVMVIWSVLNSWLYYCSLITIRLLLMLNIICGRWVYLLSLVWIKSSHELIILLGNCFNIFISFVSILGHLFGFFNCFMHLLSCNSLFKSFWFIPFR